MFFFFFLRFNLDPANAVSEEDLWKALELAQMKETIQGLPHKLGRCIRNIFYNIEHYTIITCNTLVQTK